MSSSRIRVTQNIANSVTSADLTDRSLSTAPISNADAFLASSNDRDRQHTTTSLCSVSATTQPTLEDSHRAGTPAFPITANVVVCNSISISTVSTESSNVRVIPNSSAVVFESIGNSSQTDASEIITNLSIMSSLPRHNDIRRRRSGANEEGINTITVTPDRISSSSIINSVPRRIVSSRQWKKLQLTWGYSTPCPFCGYIHLLEATAGQKSKCCLNGKALLEPFPQLQELPRIMIHYITDRLQHMGRNSVSYNSVLCCAATGVENNEGGGFETIHGDHAVRLHGRTYHFLPTSAGNGGLSFFTFDNLANCSSYATATLNNSEAGYTRIIPKFLSDIFQEMKTHNRICQECEQIGHFANEYMDSNNTANAYAIINENTSYLDVAQITSDNVTGNRIITFQRKGERYTKSIDCTDCMWEPFIYPMLFFHAERGWGADIRKNLKYTDYLIARLLCPEKITRNDKRVLLRVPNQALDRFIRPIIKQQVGPEELNECEDEAYHYYTDKFDGALSASSRYSVCIKELIKVFCNEMMNTTHITGFDEFCGSYPIDCSTKMSNKLQTIYAIICYQDVIMANPKKKLKNH